MVRLGTCPQPPHPILPSNGTRKCQGCPRSKMSGIPPTAHISERARRQTFGPANVPPCFRAIPFLFTLLRTLLHSLKAQLFSFQAIPHSLRKTTRGGGMPFMLKTLGPPSPDSRSALPLRTAWHPSPTVLSYRGHHATFAPRPLLASLSTCLSALIPVACS